MRDQPHSRGWERGFLPAGALEDVQEYRYWLTTNTMIWRGVNAAAQALEAYGHPEAERIRREADAYGKDLRRGFETMRSIARWFACGTADGSPITRASFIAGAATSAGFARPWRVRCTCS